MDTKTPSFGIFDPEMLATLEQTFKATWPLLEKESELKLGLSQTIVALVAEGVIGANELQKLALARLLLPLHEAPSPVARP